jgi:putative DNA primase/helicase
MMNPTEQFRDFAAQCDYDLSTTNIEPGRRFRFSANGKRRDDAGWGILFADGEGGVIGDWRTGAKHVWQAKRDRKMSPQEFREWQARVEREKREAQEQRQREADQAAAKAKAIWAAAKPGDTPYLQSKGVPAYGLRIYSGPQLVIGGMDCEGAQILPLRNAEGEIRTLEFIAPDGEKRFLPDGDYLGCYYAIGQPADKIMVAEGFATGASIHRATGLPVRIAATAGNLLPVARALRAKAPDVEIVLCADNDATTVCQRHKAEGLTEAVSPLSDRPEWCRCNPGITSALEASREIGGLLAIPSTPGDFNDLYQSEGPEVVTAAIKGAQPVAPKDQGKEASMQLVSVNREPAPQRKIVVVSIEDFLARELPPREVLLAPWLLSQSLNMVYAWRGVGKTHFSMNVAYALASGGQFMQWKAEKPCKVLYIDGEMPGGSLQKRLAEMVKANDKAPEPGFLNIITPDMQPDFMPIPDLATFDGQGEIDEAIEATGAEVIFLDNLSCLVRGQGKENESEGWLLVQGWALKWRAKGRSIVFIHHEGKSGAQRGTSRREDVLDTSIRLKQPPDYSPTEGACFEVHFEKARNLHGDQLSPIEARLAEDQHGRQVWTIKSLTDATYKRVVELAKVGLRQAEIAIELQVNRSTVSRHYRKAKDAGEIKEEAKV